MAIVVDWNAERIKRREGISFSSLFPYGWQVTQLQPSAVYAYVIVRWLDIEVDMAAEQKMPILKDIAGHRRREVVDYIAAHDWTVRACDPNAKVMR